MGYAAPRQSCIDLGPSDHYALIHGGHREDVAVVTQGSFTRCEILDHSRAQLAVCDTEHEPDCYMSQCGFACGVRRRQVANVSVITGAWVDLDYYGCPDLERLTPESLLDRIIEDEPWLPLPTMLTGSGRGAYLNWCFSENLPPEFLARWNKVQTQLADLLEPYGADHKAKDAARVLRISGSINSRNGASVVGQTIGEKICFEELERLVSKEHARQKPAQPLALTSPPRSGRGASTVRAIRNHYTLALARLDDLERLAELRAPMSDCRKRFMFVYGSCAAWCCSSSDEIERRLDRVVDRCFERPSDYMNRSLTTVMDRHRRGRRGERVEWDGQLVDPRYKMRTATIRKILEMGEPEGDFMVLISPEEKARRKEARNRARSPRDRATIAMQKLAVKAEARKLAARGLSQVDIAAQLGVSQPTVSRYLRGADAAAQRQAMIIQP